MRANATPINIIVEQIAGTILGTTARRTTQFKTDVADREAVFRTVPGPAIGAETIIKTAGRSYDRRLIVECGNAAGHAVQSPGRRKCNEQPKSNHHPAHCQTSPCWTKFFLFDLRPRTIFKRDTDGNTEMSVGSAPLAGPALSSQPLG
jgi:hypothetical protein